MGALKFSIVNIDSFGEKFTGTLPVSFAELSDNDTVKLSGDISYELHISAVSGGILVKGSIAAKGRSICGRCLEPCSFEVDNRDICHFIEDTESGELDLSEEIREDLILVLPFNPLCSDACEGLCSSCGEKLKDGVCVCGESVEDESPWDALDNLNLEDKD